MNLIVFAKTRDSVQSFPTGGREEEVFGVTMFAFLGKHGEAAHHLTSIESDLSSRQGRSSDLFLVWYSWLVVDLGGRRSA